MRLSANNARMIILVRTVGWLALIGLSVTTPLGLAHHSEAAYNTKSVLALRGTVEKVGWRNPHVYIHIAAEGNDGTTETWEIEGGSTPILERSGWTSTSVKPGEVVTMRVHPARKADSTNGILMSIQKEDGTLLVQAPKETTAVAASSLAGVWRAEQASVVPLMMRWYGLPLTEKANLAKEAYDVTRDYPGIQCVAPPTPRILVATILYLSEVELNDDRIIIKNEFFDAERTIWMDGREHPENGERTNQGHSIGHWEGDELVVDTRLFADNRTGNGEGVPSGAQRHTIERFKLSEDKTKLLIDVFLEDPEYLIEPLSASLEWQYAPQLQLARYNCDPEISRHYTIQ